MLDHRSRNLHSSHLVPHIRDDTTQRDSTRVVQYGADMPHRDADGGEDENGGFALGKIFTVSRESLSLPYHQHLQESYWRRSRTATLKFN